ncbi:MAG: sulfurtransferase [Rhodobacterales bacterium]|nr:MAG: sulfurtransferase [Rhodobacterales bacterium]
MNHSIRTGVEQMSQIIGAPEAYQQAKAGEIILVDIRTPQEWRQTGVGQGAIGLDMSAPDFVESLVKLRQSYPAKPIALICRTGNRSGYVFDALEQQGFPGLQNVAEGMAGGPNGKGWLKRGLPVYKGTLANIKKRLGKVLK